MREMGLRLDRVNAEHEGKIGTRDWDVQRRSKVFKRVGIICLRGYEVA